MARFDTHILPRDVDYNAPDVFNLALQIDSVA